MIVDLKWRVKAPPEPKSLFTTALEFILGASAILFFSFVTVCAVFGVAL
jgi:hypothetical protein